MSLDDCKLAEGNTDLLFSAMSSPLALQYSSDCIALCIWGERRDFISPVINLLQLL